MRDAKGERKRFLWTFRVLVSDLPRPKVLLWALRDLRFLNKSPVFASVDFFNVQPKDSCWRLCTLLQLLSFVAALLSSEAGGARVSDSPSNWELCCLFSHLFYSLVRPLLS